MSFPKPHIVVTGATGFIGSHVMQALSTAGEYPLGLCRKPTEGFVHGFDLTQMGDLSKVLTGAKTVVHCAARVHGKEDPATELADHRLANRDATADLIKQAEKAGVQHFIFLSTIAVYGIDSTEETIAVDHPTNPQSAYGIAKLEAEEILRQSTMRITILRVPMVYGPNAPGLWQRLCKLANSPYPIPFGYIGNRRSLIAVQNLADLIRHCVQTADLPQTILATDHEDLGTTGILQSLRKSLGRPERLIPAPKPILRGVAKLLRRPYLYDHLFTSLRFAPTPCGWTPPLGTDQALREAAPKR